MMMMMGTTWCWAIPDCLRVSCLGDNGEDDDDNDGDDGDEDDHNDDHDDDDDDHDDDEVNLVLGYSRLSPCLMSRRQW